MATVRRIPASRDHGFRRGVRQCSKRPHGTAGFDAEAKQFTPPAGKANFYIAWSNSSSGGRALDISVDGKLLGPIAPGTFYLVAVDPGKHTVSAKVRDDSSNVAMDAAAGKNYYFEVTASTACTASKAQPRGGPDRRDGQDDGAPDPAGAGLSRIGAPAAGQPTSAAAM